MLYILKEDITKLKDIDVLVNAANGIGVMGAGVAGYIRRSGGDLLEKNVKNICMLHGKPFECGEIYSSDPGLLKRRGYKVIYHAVVMKYPGSPTSTKIVQDLCHSIVNKARTEGYKTIAVPGMGTGIGKLDKKQVARIMVDIFCQYSSGIDIHLTDFNDDFIKHAEENLNRKKENK